jgi:8-oxo-dGTP pyrophosphatase MutT (NUDIX family)
MTVNATPAVPVPSASVLLLRDGVPDARGHRLEVLLQRRAQSMAALGGMHVFPGGKVDPQDGAMAATAGLLDVPPATDTTNTTGLNLRVWQVAALRELFEEAGVLLALGAHDRPPAAEALPALRAEVLAGADWVVLLRKHSLRWHTAALQPFTRWITPLQPAIGRHRFDTLFFLARLPEGQTVLQDTHEGAESTESLWLRPREAMEQYQASRMELVPPQLMGLAQLARHPTVHSAWQEAAARPAPTVLPHTFSVHGVRHMCYPGDPDHPIAERAMPGPTRLRLHEGRFEPLDGFAGWFA